MPLGRVVYGVMFLTSLYSIIQSMGLDPPVSRRRCFDGSRNDSSGLRNINVLALLLNI